MGRESYDAGKEFEARMKNAWEVAKQTGIIVWDAHQEPAFTISRKPIKASGADLVGVLRGGLMIAQENKSVQGERLEFDLIVPDPTAKRPYGAFTAEQVAHLNGAMRAGAVALVGVEFRVSPVDKRAFLIPWFELGKLWRARVSRRSVDLDDIPSVWAMPHERVIASRLVKCEGCGAYRPPLPQRTNCCWGAQPPF